MDSLVVQTGGRSGGIAELTRSKEGRLSVGRGYGNDLVLTDQHVAPEQLIFCQEGEQWLMQVLDHANPVLVNNKRVRDDQIAVSSGDKVTVGRTRLSLYSDAHPVEKTRKLFLSNWLAMESSSFILPVIVLLGFCTLDLVLSYFEGSTTLEWEEYAYGILFSSVVIVSWAGIWAITGSIVRQQQHFGLQLIVASIISLLATILSFIAAYLAYPFHSTTVTEIFEWGFLFIILVALFQLNLLIATNIRNTLAVAFTLTALVSGVAFAFLYFGEEDDAFYLPLPSTTLVPPAFQLSRESELDDYFSRVARESTDLDEQN
ncbi:FHA domain-containing protein [Halioglobus sp.]|nr:FHA domain-containing protein [Halioglobus sp.]